MGTVEQRAAVRVELGEDDGIVGAPPVEPAERSGAGGRTIGVVIAGLLIVGAMIWITRPDDGQTAAGTPITVPSTAPPEERTSGEVVGSEDNGVRTPTTTSEDDVARPAFDSVVANAFLFSIVRADLGWIALGFGDNNPSATLFRTIDGLNWTNFANDSLPDGDLLGLDRYDGTYMIAIDEGRTWSEARFDFEETGTYPEHRVSIWTSTDAVTWKASDLPVLEGVGFPYLSSLTRDSYVVPMIDAPENRQEALIEFLAPFVDADVAALVCSSSKTYETATPTVVLEDCDGEILAEVAADEFPDDFDKVWNDYCVELARSSGSQRFTSIVVTREGAPARVELSSSRGLLFGRAVPNGFLTRSQVASEVGLPEECGGTFDPAPGGPAGSGITFWGAETGQRDVTPTTPSVSDEFIGFDSTMVLGLDDRLYVTMGGSVWAGIAPFDEWEQVLTTPPEIRFSLATSLARLTLSGDGWYALLAMPDNLYVAPLGGGEWSHVAYDGWSDTPQIIVATDDYIVVRDQGDSEDRFVKVPLR